ncbi:reverse transcriptase domain-containing protein [Tanacetum coccineum]
MTDRSDEMMTRAFISGLRPGRFFKDLIARRPASMEDLFTQAHNFIRADEVNTRNRLRDSSSDIRHIRRKGSSLASIMNVPTRSPKRPHKGAKTQNSNQNPSSSGVSERGKNQVGWKQKMAEPKETNEILMTSTQWSPIRHRPDASPPGTNIAFSEEDPVLEHCNGEDPLIIKANIRGTVIHRVYVDGGSSTEIMYEHCFQQLTNKAKALIRSPTSPLVGFAGQVLWPLGVITIPLTLFDYHRRGSKTVTTDFLIVRAPLPYNGILGRPGMRQLGAIASTIHPLLKFSTPTGVAIVRGDMPCKNTCLQVSRKREREPEEATKLASPENKSEKEEVEINPLYPDQKVIIGTSLPLKLKEELQKLLRANQDIFAWSPLDMTGIPRELAEHKLNIHPSTFPVRQKKRVLAERNDAVNQEVIKLVKAIILKEVYSPRWVANPVMIRMAEEDEEKTAFYMEHGTFCYEKMPFGLRNAGATYQRLVDKAFSSQLGRNIKIYVEDMAMKSRNVKSLIADIEETFHTSIFLIRSSHKEIPG